MKFLVLVWWYVLKISPLDIVSVNILFTEILKSDSDVTVNQADPDQHVSISVYGEHP